MYAPVTGYDSLYSATGIEKTEDRFLSGSDPQLTVHNLIDLVTGKPRRGATVQLTINSAAQTTAYEQLKATGLPSGAVAIDPKTGAILALASYPTFNPNKYATFDSAQLKRVDNHYLNDPGQPLLNRAINQTFPPGSTFKVVTSSTAFSTGNYNPQTRVYAPTNLKLPGTTKDTDQLRQLCPATTAATRPGTARCRSSMPSPSPATPCSGTSACSSATTPSGSRPSSSA